MNQPDSTTQTRLPFRPRSRSHSPVSRPTTPLRPSSRSSFRTSQTNALPTATPLDTLEPQFAELSDSMADLEANFTHLQLMHESLSRFSESFASFLYGLNMNAFISDFPEAPIVDSIKRFHKQRRRREGEDVSTTTIQSSRGADGETTYMTSDASYVDSTSIKATPRRKVGGEPRTPGTGMTARSGGGSARGTRGAARGARGSGLPRGRGRM